MCEGKDYQLLGGGLICQPGEDRLLTETMMETYWSPGQKEGALCIYIVISEEHWGKACCSHIAVRSHTPKAMLGGIREMHRLVDTQTDRLVDTE